MLSTSRIRIVSLVLFCALSVLGPIGCTTEVPPQEADVVSEDDRGVYDPERDPLVNPTSLFEPAPEEVEYIASDDILYRSVEANPSDLNPLFQSSTYEFYFAYLLYEPLFNFGKDMKWRVNPTMVEEFEESPDHLTYTITLRRNLKWHDGEPYTAHDVVFSWQNILDDRVPCPAVRTGTDQIADCEALDDHTVVMTHKRALPTNPWNALFPIIPKHIYQQDKKNNPDLKSGPYNNNANRRPIGNGAYKFVEWMTNDKIVLKRWEEFTGPRPNYAKIVFRIIPDNNIRLLTFNKGDIDETILRDKQFATQTLEGSDFSKRGYKVMAPQWIYSYICWNMDGSNPFFTDLRVRQALAHACNKPRMIRDLTYNLKTVSHGILHPEHPMFNKDIKPLEFDLTKAQALLDEAGWKIDPSRGGWRHKEIDGSPVKFEFAILIPQGSAIGREVAAIYKEDLQSIGVSLKTQIIEWATFQERTRKHEFQASMAAWGTGTDPDTLWNIWHSESYRPDGSAGRNYGAFRNERVDELFAMGRKEFDPAKRAEYYSEISKIVHDEQPYNFMFTRSTLWGVAKRIRGLQTSPRGIFNFSPAEKAWWTPSPKYPGLQNP